MVPHSNSFRNRCAVSVITVVFNGVKNIEGTILSVLNQSYRNVEYLVVDGGSTDGTLDVIRKYEDKIDRLVSEPDKGIYDAMNKGIGLATGEWINFMNCGDRFASRDVLEMFNGNFNGADLVYGDAIQEYPTFQTKFKKFPLTSMWREMPFCHQAAFVKASLMKEYKFDLHYRLSADYDFIYRAYVANKKFVYVDKLVCLFDFKGGASKSYAFDSIDERRHSSLKHRYSVWKRLYYFFYRPYVKIKIFFKKKVGDKATAWITRLLRTQQVK